MTATKRLKAESPDIAYAKVPGKTAKSQVELWLFKLFYGALPPASAVQKSCCSAMKLD